jgi:hypothetical protein
MVILNGQDRKSDEFRPRTAMTFASLSWRSERQLSIFGRKTEVTENKALDPV